MIISGFGVRLIKLAHEHIELVRQKRNSPSIRQFMEYQDHISKEMQESWFYSLSETNDFFFLIEYGNEYIGLIHTSSIDWNDQSGNAGLYLWEEKYLSTYVPVLASLSMVDFFFKYTRLDKLYAKVKGDNRVAADYNKRLGFKEISDEKHRYFRKYLLNSSDYASGTVELHQLAMRVESDNYQVAMDEPLFLKLQESGALDSKIAESSFELIGAKST